MDRWFVYSERVERGLQLGRDVVRKGSMHVVRPAITPASHMKATSMTKRKAQSKSKGAKPKATVSRKASVKPLSQSKASICIGLLSRKEGASIVELQKATGWQPHSVRGFLSGKINKAAELKLTSEKAPDGVRRYHV